MKHCFLPIGPTPINLYPIVDSAAWLAKLLPLGINTIQLRIKNVAQAVLHHEIESAVALAKQYHARLFINDYWQLAIEYGAYGVHLGQEDLQDADLNQLHQAGLRLGVSTHSLDEINTALSIKPSYLAFGPIFPTSTKIMKFSPQGLEELKYWCEHLTYPLVAIGGINLARIPEVLATGVVGVAMISAITQAADPIAITKKMLELF